MSVPMLLPERLQLIVKTVQDYREGLPPGDRHLGSTTHSKVYRYGQESYFQESYRDFSFVFGAHATSIGSLTYVLFKPDAFVARAAERTLSVLDELGFEPIASTIFQFDRYRVRELWRYEFNIARVERYRLIDDLLCSGPSLLVILKDTSGSSVDASVRLSRLKGNSNLAHRTPDSIRNRIGARANTLNFIHTPDELIDMVREFGVLLDDHARLALLQTMRMDERPDLQNTIDAIYALYPEHLLLLEDIYGRFGDVLKADVATNAGILADQPYRLHRELVARHGLDPWDWITIVNSHLRFSHDGILPVFSFESV